MSKHKCVECREEGNEFMHVISRLIKDENGRESTIKEFWCFSCVFKRTLWECNETQKQLRAEARDIRFMSKSDKKTYAFRPPRFEEDEE